MDHACDCNTVQVKRRNNHHLTEKHKIVITEHLSSFGAIVISFSNSSALVHFSNEDVSIEDLSEAVNSNSVRAHFIYQWACSKSSEMEVAASDDKGYDYTNLPDFKIVLDSITFRKTDMLRYEPEEWLSTDDIDYHAARLLKDMESALILPLAAWKFARQPEKILKKMEDKRFVFIPVNENSHWSLLVIDLLKKSGRHFDSLAAEKFNEFEVVRIRSFLESMLDCTIFMQKVSACQQSNKNDCGIFVLLNIRALAICSLATPSFSSESVINMRIQLRNNIISQLG